VRSRIYCIVIAMFLLLPQNVPSQQTPPLPEIAPPGGMRNPQKEPEPGIPAEMQKRMEKETNQQRQGQLKRDADRLLKLSTELKDYVDKSNENILSLDVIKKADEIEKLAHSVKTKMRGND
jgi:hypothetical protein